MIDKIKKIMAEIFEVDINEIDTSISQESYKIWDSLKHLNLIIALENEFNISLEPEEIGEMVDFKKVLFFIESKLID